MSTIIVFSGWFMCLLFLSCSAVQIKTHQGDTPSPPYNIAAMDGQRVVMQSCTGDLPQDSSTNLNVTWESVYQTGEINEIIWEDGQIIWEDGQNRINVTEKQDLVFIAATSTLFLAKTYRCLRQVDGIERHADLVVLEDLNIQKQVEEVYEGSSYTFYCTASFKGFWGPQIILSINGEEVHENETDVKMDSSTLRVSTKARKASAECDEAVLKCDLAFPDPPNHLSPLPGYSQYAPQLPAQYATTNTTLTVLCLA